MRNFLMSPFAPWLIASAVLLLGVVIWLIAGRFNRTAVRWVVRIPALLIMGLGVAMITGAAITASKMAAALADHPPPGVMVDVNGTAIHVWCEGDANGKPAIVLMPGGYAQGLWMRHLQKSLSTDYRACLVDRPGLGYSEARSMPNSTERVVDEVHKAMAGAGEQYPVVMAGHSFGGLFAANFAAIHPDDVAGLILLDPTAPSHELARSSNECEGPGYSVVFSCMFGLAYIRSLNPMYGPYMAEVREAVGDDWDTLVTFEIRPSALIGKNSAFNASCRNPLSSVPPVEGRLGDIPLLQILQAPEPEGGRPAWLAHLSDFEYANHEAWYASAKSDYLRMSSRSKNEYAPVGAGHDFPHTERDFTLSRIREFLESL